MSEQIKDGGPAFPVAEERWIDPMHPRKGSTNFDGMTLRDYFASKAMQAIWGAFVYSLDAIKTPDCLDEIARDAYAQADAMLAAREAKP